MNNKSLLTALVVMFVGGVLSLYLFSYYVVLADKDRHGLFNFGHVTHEEVEHPKHMNWSFDGVFGTVDKQSAQRGYQVYKEVCASCHGMALFSFRNLAGIGFPEAEIKEIAKEYEYEITGDDGETETRPGVPNDKMLSPYANTKAAAAANGGAVPPDLSLMVKARHDGANYVYSLLTGYQDAPEGVVMNAGMNYNPYFPGKQLAMAAPLSADQVSYEDGTEATVEQMSKDVVAFMQYAAEPEMEERKRMGVKAIIFLIIMTLFFYVAKVRIWARVKK